MSYIYLIRSIFVKLQVIIHNKRTEQRRQDKWIQELDNSVGHLNKTILEIQSILSDRDN